MITSLFQAPVRARWLAELSTALDDAQSLTHQWVEQVPNDDRAASLGRHIAELRAELASLRRGGFHGQEIACPIWSDPCGTLTSYWG